MFLSHSPNVLFIFSSKHLTSKVLLLTLIKQVDKKEDFHSPNYHTKVIQINQSPREGYWGAGEVGLGVVGGPLRQPLFHSITQPHTWLHSLSSLFSFDRQSAAFLLHHFFFFTFLSPACLNIVCKNLFQFIFHLPKAIRGVCLSPWKTPLLVSPSFKPGIQGPAPQG